MNLSPDISRMTIGETTSSTTITSSTGDLTPRSSRSTAKTITSDRASDTVRHGVVPYVYSDYQKWERRKTPATSSHKNPLYRQFSQTKHTCCHAGTSSAERPPMWCGARSKDPVLPRVKYRSLKHESPEIAMLKAQIEAKKMSIQEYKKHKKTLTADSISMIEAMQKTDASTYKNVKLSLDRYQRFKGAIVSVRDRSTREVSQAKEELLLLKSQTQAKADALQQEVKTVETNLHKAQDELQVLQHYKEREYPIRLAQIDQLKDQLTIMQEKQLNDIKLAKENALIEKNKIHERMMSSKHGIEAQAAQLTLSSVTKSVLERGVHNKVMIKEVKRHRSQLIELESTITQLKTQIQMLTCKIRNMRMVKSPLAAMGRCNPDTEFLLDIPIQAELQF